MRAKGPTKEQKAGRLGKGRGDSIWKVRKSSSPAKSLLVTVEKRNQDS